MSEMEREEAANEKENCDLTHSTLRYIFSVALGEQCKNNETEGKSIRCVEQ